MRNPCFSWRAPCLAVRTDSGYRPGTWKFILEIFLHPPFPVAASGCPGTYPPPETCILLFHIPFTWQIHFLAARSIWVLA